jgi:hypothetical protein
MPRPRRCPPLHASGFMSASSATSCSSLNWATAASTAPTARCPVLRFRSTARTVAAAVNHAPRRRSHCSSHRAWRACQPTIQAATSETLQAKLTLTKSATRHRTFPSIGQRTVTFFLRQLSPNATRRAFIQRPLSPPAGKRPTSSSTLQFSPSDNNLAHPRRRRSTPRNRRSRRGNPLICGGSGRALLRPPASA